MASRNFLLALSTTIRDLKGKMVVIQCHVKRPRVYSRIISLEIALEKQAVLELDLADVLGLGQRVGVCVEKQDQHHHQHKVAVELKSR